MPELEYKSIDFAAIYVPRTTSMNRKEPRLGSASSLPKTPRITDVWQNYVDLGFVETSGDRGARGTPPRTRDGGEVELKTS